jgi:serine/threonine-protein kinase
MDATTTSANTLGKYRLLAELGHGGMAQVFLALAKGVGGFNKLVVVKQIHAELAEDQEFVRMFLDEARLAARLNHPNVVQTNEVDQDGRRYYIAMEYLEGQSLNRIFNRMGRDPKLLPLGHRLRLIADALAGLHYAHELRDYDGQPLGVVHRDVTPHNIFVTYNGLVKVVDFGIAKALNSSVQTQSGVLKGKVSYMAPEQARGERVDRRADIFSVGMMLWQVATGRRLYRDLPELAVIQKICSGDVPKVKDLAPFVPERLQVIIDRSLAPDREERYATAGELQADIEAFLDHAGARVSSREIGVLVAEHFADERTEIQGIIDEQLRREVHDDSVRSLPNIEISQSGSGRSVSAVVQSTTGLSPGAMAPSGDTATSVTYTGPTFQRMARLQRRRRLAMVAGAAAVVGGGLVAAWVLSGRAPDGAAANASAAPTSEPATAFQLRIESTPLGADVLEGGRKIGTTPAVIPIEPGKGAAREFVVQAEGYEPFTVRPGELSSDLTVRAPLVALTTTSAATASVRPTPGTRPTRAPGGDKPKTTAPATTSDGLDIRTNR